MPAINFRKLKSQIKPLAPEAGGAGYIFIATDEQKNSGMCSVSQYGSKRNIIKSLIAIINHDVDWQKEFILK